MPDVFFADQWTRAHAELGIPSDAKVLSDLLALWGGDGRHYHSLAHLKYGLVALDRYGEGVGLVRLAWFFHDAIYVIGRGDNEQLSADWFTAYARRQNLKTELVDRGERLILMTKDHQGAVSDDPLWPIMNDVDLAVFATPPDVYEVYAANVWREYEAIATRQQFVLGRAAFMSAFKSRPVFQTEAMRNCEQAAHRNIDAEVARLMDEARQAGWLPEGC
ncbi:hypothetical protein [Phenylobacterium sp. SCN 70-31]|mgnify:CR=1 FL=1|uniref:HD domain-containing protein n=1 Tax=Phenylobacterium sp. SCN 70-31 TaxID=1660129 RepID=UPI000868316C|nr:hypothetical protein [Phenylobacterium sp. SCN 70-31]ODT88700.1 MAG: hypothetical protein ABS78_05960 [Phenylobacterium sp. SCN 70-31]